MDLRRAGEFVFGAAVLSCGGAFLALAVGRLSAPVVEIAAPASTAAPAAIATRVASVSRGRAPVAAHVLEIALAEKPLPAPVSAPASVRAPRPRSDRVAPRPSTPPHGNVSKANGITAVSTAPVGIRKQPDAKPRVWPQTQRAQASQSRGASARTPLIARPTPTKAATPSRKLAMRPAPRHRYGVAYVRIRPAAERTPEPPIGYDDHPALLRSETPSVAAPAIAPVQIELQTSHLPQSAKS